MTNGTIVGRGIFGWNGIERRSDRYGTFVLDFSTYGEKERFDAAAWEADPSTLVGRECRISVRVLEARESGHVGDIMRGIFPEMPDVGETVELGHGKLFVEASEFGSGHVAVGIMPDDGRDADWFEPIKLYRLHDQTVEVALSPVD